MSAVLHCSAMSRARRAAFVGIALVVVLGACSKSERSEHAPAATATPGGKGAAQGERAAKAGEPLKLDDSVWMVVETKDLGKKVDANTSYGEPKETAGRFVQVRYKVTNTGKKPESVLDPPRIVDDKGRELTRLDLESLYVPAKLATLGIELLPPHVEKEYATLFDVPADARGLKLQLRGLGLLGERRQIDLGI